MRTHRRTVLLGALGGAALTACSTDEASEPTSPPSDPVQAPSADGSSPVTPDDRTRVLLIFFSRAGENYYYGDRTDLEVGNTKVLARMIAERTGCDLHEIEAADPYSDDYDATVRRNVEEQESDARPAIAGPLPDVSGYDVVLLASPIWNVQPPMIMRTLTEGLDLRGTTVHPVVTYAVSGLGTAEDVYAETCPGADLRRGLAVRGEEVADAGPDVDAWLRETGLART